MNVNKVRRTIALALLALLLLATICIGLLAKPITSPNLLEWLHAFCLMQCVLLTACAVYGPGRLITRLPLAVAWGLAVGFTMATHNLITIQGRASFAGGVVLGVAATLPPLLIFAIHRWRTGASVAYGTYPGGQISTRPLQQISLQMLMILIAAFAVTGLVARAAFAAGPDPYGNEHDVLVIHAWLGLFPSLVAAPVLLVVFRPSWRILLVFGFFVLVALADPLLLALSAGYLLQDQRFFPTATGDVIREIGIESFIWHGQAVIAVLIYTLLARAAGFRMIVPDQSSDKKPKPSARPAAEAGCVQD